MHIRERFLCGNTVEVEEKHMGRYGAPGMARAKKEKPTPEQIRKQNQWKKETEIRRLLKCNFAKEDFWITLTYSPGQRPADMVSAKKRIQKFLRNMKTRYKKTGVPMKYIVCTEIGSRGGIHHHVVMNRIRDGDKYISKYWTYGRAAIELMKDSQEDYRRLADYIAKEPAPDNSIREKWYSRSRNLQKPVRKKRIISERTFKKDIKVPKGYMLDKSSVREGINQVTGHPYRYYTLVKVVEHGP